MENENVVVEEKKGKKGLIGIIVTAVIVGLATLFGIKTIKNRFSKKNSNEEVNTEIETTNEE